LEVSFAHRVVIKIEIESRGAYHAGVVMNQRFGESIGRSAVRYFRTAAQAVNPAV
jgi:hypothetical protein